LNAEFYTKFPYPWPPMKFDRLVDPGFETVMLNQALGDWGNRTIPARPRIWVAGCGTNLAVFVALRFPTGTIVGSDLSPRSLEICAQTASQLEIGNLELRRESINDVAYAEEFDYVVCTGVIHHTADPAAALRVLARAMKPSGVLELMVYNRYHFIVPTAVQKAIRILSGGAATIEMDRELAIARRLVESFPVANSVAEFLARFRSDAPDAMLADLATQPVAYSYTVESLEDLAEACGLELLVPCVNEFDKTDGRLSWNIELGDADLQERYDALPDTRRWQVANLLLAEQSPMLWFYLQRKTAERPRKSEKEICEEFLETTFVRAETRQNYFLRTAEGTYRSVPSATPFPIGRPDAHARPIAAAVDGKTPMRKILERAGVPATFRAVNAARLALTTPAFPYLRSVQSLADRDRAGLASTREDAPSPVGTWKERNMEERKNLVGSKLEKLRSVKRKPVVVPRKGLVRTGTLESGATLPLVIEPEIEDVDLTEWTRNNLELLESRLARHGAILFRGFGVDAAAPFEDFARSIREDLFNENGEHPREVVSGNVYTPVFYPPEKKLLWHNENSFNFQWPAKIWFCCLKPAREGGETPIVDSRQVYETLDPGIREVFERKQVMYVRNHWEGLGLSWQTLFRTTDRAVVEERCRRAQMEWEWKGDNLVTRQVRPAVVRHPVTGEMSWFNQIQHWHVACLDPEVRASLTAEFSEEDLPRHAYYGDGTPIEDSVMQEILDVYQGLEVVFPWQAGDILMVDNISTAHARNPYAGERKLLVSMAEMLSYADVPA
jgi:SAM-dependent methyltransferase/alpha-ketoglutarate-dependent taurine dioxygenase